MSEIWVWFGYSSFGLESPCQSGALVRDVPGPAHLVMVCGDHHVCTMSGAPSPTILAPERLAATEVWTVDELRRGRLQGCGLELLKSRV
jgi:hypothetical protein